MEKSKKLSPKDKAAVNQYFGTHDHPGETKLEFSDDEERKDFELNAANKWFGVHRIGKS